MPRTILLALLVLVSLDASARAQFNILGPGSTPQGDYLRGVGVAAYGIGMGEMFEANATAINLDTSIRFWEYVAAVLKNENAENAQHRGWLIQKKQELFNEIRKRVLENPEARDIDKGNALNAVLDQMNKGLIQESTHRYAEIPISVDQVRRIPFTLARKG